MDQPIARIEQVTHRFNKQVVLNNISLAIPRGSIYGFLGPNGAGKTTTLRLLLGLIQRQSGHINLFEQDIASNRIELLRRIGSLIEQPSLYLHLNATENLEIYRLSYQCEKKRIGEVLEIVRLTGAGTKKVRSYSLGMKQRLAIAIALLPNPELLVLDEPSNGLDPNGIIEMRMLIKQLYTEEQKTIIISSHLLGEIEKIATHLAIIHQGKILFQGGLPELQQLRSGHAQVEIEVDDPGKAMQLLSGMAAFQLNNGKLVTSFTSREQIAEANAVLVQQGVRVYQLNTTQKDLENLFLQIISGQS